MVSSHQLVFGWGLQKWRLSLPCGPMWLGKDFAFFTTLMLTCIHGRKCWCANEFVKKWSNDFIVFSWRLVNDRMDECTSVYLCSDHSCFWCLLSEKLANVRGHLVTKVCVDEHLLSCMMENSSLTFREKTEIQKVRALLILAQNILHVTVSCLG